MRWVPKNERRNVDVHPAYDLTFYEFDEERDTKVWDVML
jgi:hypothetical protein